MVTDGRYQGTVLKNEHCARVGGEKLTGWGGEESVMEEVGVGGGLEG